MARLALRFHERQSWPVWQGSDIRLLTACDGLEKGGVGECAFWAHGGLVSVVTCVET